MADPQIVVRPAGPPDVAQIVAFIHELAEYEKLADQCFANEAALRDALFGPSPRAEVLFAECDREPAGFALFFHNFSTFLSRPGLYLEDLFVRPALRGRGIGFALLKRLAAVAVERGCGRLEWAVLNWNTPAIEFYERLGARPMNEWTVYRLTDEALAHMARSSHGETPGQT